MINTHKLTNSELPTVDEQLIHHRKMLGTPTTEKTRQIPFVLGSGSWRFRLVAEDPKNSKPTGQSLEGPVSSPAFNDHLHHGHNMRVVQGRVKIQGLPKRSGQSERSRPARRELRDADGLPPHLHHSHVDAANTPCGEQHPFQAPERSGQEGTPSETDTGVTAPPSRTPGICLQDCLLLLWEFFTHKRCQKTSDPLERKGVGAAMHPTPSPARTMSPKI